MSVEHLIERFRQTAVEYGVAMEADDVRGCDRGHAQMERHRRELLTLDGETQKKVLSLLDDDDPAVRLHAAMEALRLATDDGLRVLRALASGSKSQVRINAIMILQEWEAGRWAGD